MLSIGDFMSTIEDLKTRRSVRSFKDEKISHEELSQIIEAGENAPCGLGAGSPRIIVIQDKEVIDELALLNKSFFPEGVVGEDYTPFFDAANLLIVIADKNVPTYVEDGSLVIGNMLNAAHSLGLGACFIYRAKEMIASPEGQKLLEKLDIPDNYVGVGNVILGYLPDDFEYPESPKRDYAIYYPDYYE